MTITPEQCRAARSLLYWSQPKLANAVGVTRETIGHFERGATTPYPDTLKSIQTALEAAGVIFIEKDRVAGVGVRLRG